MLKCNTSLVGFHELLMQRPLDFKLFRTPPYSINKERFHERDLRENGVFGAA